MITWNFSGQMDDTGDLFAGYFSFDNERPDGNTSESRGIYRFDDLSQADLVFDLNGARVFASEVTPDGRMPDWVAEADILNDLDGRGDLIRFTYNVLISPSPLIPDIQEFNVDLFFIDETGAWLSDAMLPTGPINLASLLLDPNIEGWGDHFGLTSAAILRLSTDTIQSGPQFDFGTITSLSVANPVPEPSTLLLLGSGIVGLGLIRIRFQNTKNGQA